MIGAFRAAVIMLRRPALLWPALGAVVLFSVTSVTFTFTTAAAPGGSRLTNPPTTLADLSSPDTLSRVVGQPVMVLGLVVLATSILHLTGQYTSGLVRVQFVRQPRRSVWLLGNALALVVAAILASIVAAAIAVASAFVSAAIWRVDTATWGGGMTDALVGVGNLALGMSAFALLGCALGLWLRSSIAALTVALVYALFENLINAVAPFGQGLLPASAFSTVATSGFNGTPYLPALVATLVVTAAVVGGAVSLVVSRDVTD